MVAMTIGMATYNDFDGVYFTVQSLRLYQDLTDTEILIVDNFGCDHTRDFMRTVPNARYLRYGDVSGTAAPRDLVFREALGDAVVCCDSHVLLAPGVIARLRAYYRDHPESIDLLQGPLLNDDLSAISTHFEPVWRAQMWGVWATDLRGLDPDGEPFDIPMQGLGLFSCRKAAWPGFNPAFRGFGGEEGYIHEKVRQRGGRTLCLPWLRWGHRFGRPAGVPYRLTVDDKLRNYVIGHAELGLELRPVLEHFSEYLPFGTLAAVAEAAVRDQQIAALPLVSCICPTYNRLPKDRHLIEEAIESFLRQDYPNKELIVLNDAPGQELVCTAPGVRVVNVAQRFASLGEKRNAGLALARGELIAPWDDDDISLPTRLSWSVEQLGDAAYYNPQRSWYMEEGELKARAGHGVGHNLCLFRRSAIDAVGGYPAITLGEDVAVDSALAERFGRLGERQGDDAGLGRQDWYYIYRWGVSPVHLSGSPDPDYWQAVGDRAVQAGRYELKPHWRMEYAVAAERMAAVLTAGEIGLDEAADGGNLIFMEHGGKKAQRPTRLEFPLAARRKAESKADHLRRVRRMIDRAEQLGASYLLLPPDATAWFSENPYLVKALGRRLNLASADRETGLLFALRHARPTKGKKTKRGKRKNRKHS